MNIPEKPSEMRFFGPQYGYSDIKIHTQKYSGKPTPLSGQQSSAGDFIASHTDKKHQKEFVKKGGKKLFGFIKNNVFN